MNRLLDDLLDVSRITQNKIALNKTEIDLRSTVEDAVQSVQSLADDHSITVEISLPDESLPIIGDAARLQQVQANLLTNAIKYSPAGSRVQLTHCREDQSAVIRVSDKGSGITPDLLDSVFDMFVQSDHTLDRAHGGMGVGLTLVRNIVELHDGSVTAQSDGPGNGSLFIVRLPITEPSGVEGSSAAAGPPQHQAVSRVVVIEDNDDNRQMLTNLLELEGFEVSSAPSGREGVEMVVQLRPDAAVIDIGLPEINGYEVAEKIRADKDLSRRILLLALTGYGQPQDVRRAVEAGFDHHLVKPLQPDRLIALLKGANVA
jgi:two-component system CheB/CheR fusion protein